MITKEQAKVGTKVKSNVEFAGVPKGTHGIIDEDYGTGVMIAWEPLPKDYKEYDGKWACVSGILRDGFDKRGELIFLDLCTE